MSSLNGKRKFCPPRCLCKEPLPGEVVENPPVKPIDEDNFICWDRFDEIIAKTTALFNADPRTRRLRRRHERQFKKHFRAYETGII